MKKTEKFMSNFMFWVAKKAGDGASAWLAYQPKEPDTINDKKKHIKSLK